MFYFEKMFDRDFAVRTVALLARKACGYKDPSTKEPLKQVFCDCKYGIADHPDEELMRRHSEQTGCPELSMLEDIIKNTPKREWERIVKKALRVREAKKRV